MKAFSLSFREQLLADLDSGMRCKDVAPKWNVSLWTLSRLRRLRRENQSLEPKPKGNGPKPKLEPYKDLIQQIIDENPDSTLEDIRSRLPIKVCVATVYNTLTSMGISFKKNGLRVGAKSSGRC